MSVFDKYKITGADFKGSRGPGSLPVTSRKFNELVGLVETLGHPTEVQVNTIDEYVTGQGLLIEGVLFKDDAIAIPQAGGKIYFDTDLDTYISAATYDDVIDFYTGGSRGLRITNTQFTIDRDVNLWNYDISLGTGAGTKIGVNATQKLAFYGNTPIVQPSVITQQYNTPNTQHNTRTAFSLADNTGGGAIGGSVEAISTIATATATALALSTGDTYTDAAVNTAVNTAVDSAVDSAVDTAVNAAIGEINDENKELVTDHNRLRADQVNTAQVLNSVIDKLQALGLIDA